MGEIERGRWLQERVRDLKGERRGGGWDGGFDISKIIKKRKDWRL